MTIETARAAAAQVGVVSDPPRPLAAGRSSQAWMVGSTTGTWVVRVPIPDSGRAISYRSEAHLSDLLGRAGHPVVPWTVVEVGDVPCSVGPLVDGTPVDDGGEFGSEFAAALGRLLHDLHALPVDGFGPLDNDGNLLQGQSGTNEVGIARRWCHARMWPFDHGDLAEHAIVDHAPSVVERVTGLRDQILAAADGPNGVQHSDLHRQHLLRTDDDRLAAVLDFGASFVGSIGWDFASLLYYYGPSNVERVAAAYPGAPLERGRLLALAVGLYKMAKNPAEPHAVERFHRLLGAIESP